MSDSTKVQGYIENLYHDPEKVPLKYISDYMVFMFQPMPIRKSLAANRSELNVLGMSHSYKTYNSTSNQMVSFDLYFNTLMLMGELKLQRSDMVGFIKEHENYISALLYPAEANDGYAELDTPLCYLHLPGVVSMNCRLDSINNTVTDLFDDGTIKEMRINCTFSEELKTRRTMQDALIKGLNSGGN